VLRKHPQAAVQVFAVWEPILDTDTAQPNLQALERLYDNRVRQYWDPDHRISKLLKALQLPAHCCVYESTYLWDLIAVYPPAAKWQSVLPMPTFFDGTMVKRAPDLDALLHP
jgi:hypothetical protein